MDWYSDQHEQKYKEEKPWTVHITTVHINSSQFIAYNLGIITVLLILDYYPSTKNIQYVITL